jgi:hypothetical protein
VDEAWLEWSFAAALGVMRTLTAVLTIAWLSLAAGVAGGSPEKALLELDRWGTTARVRVEVYRSGLVVTRRETVDAPTELDGVRQRRGDLSLIRQLEQTVRAERFLRLPDRLEPMTVSPDDESITMTVWLDGRKKSVFVMGSQLDTRTDPINRFRAVLAAVDRLLAEP